MAPQRSKGVITAAAVTGVGLSGFFDGILLHQVLQWHHLLSLVPGEPWQSIENQILADGLFHALMYGVTALGLLLLWRARRELGKDGTGARHVGGGFLLGFGIWNVIDVGFFHWTLGIHRIRVDVPEPLIYDLAWLAFLGLIPLTLAWLFLRSGGRGQGGREAAAILGVAALFAAPISSLPPPGSDTALVLFAPEMGSASAFAAAHQAATPVLWMNAGGTVAAVDLTSPSSRGALYLNGARLVTRSPALAGCLAALRS